MMNYQWIILLVISLIHSIHNIVHYKLNSIKFSLIPLLFLAQIFVSLLTTFITLNIPETLIDTSKLITLVLILFNTYIVIKNDQPIRDYIFILIAISSVVESFAIFLTFIENYNLSVVQKAGRSFIYRGITGNINVAGFSIAMKLPFLLYYCINRKKILYKLILGILITICIFSISLTGSRGALLSLYVIIFLSLAYYLIEAYRSKTFKKLFNSLHIVIPFSTVFIINELIFNTLRISYRTAQIFERGSASRISYWKDAIESIIDNPLLGVGMGNWKIFSVKYGGDQMRDYTFVYHAHNDFLQTIAEIGILGLIYLIIPVILLITLIKRIIKRKSASFEFFLGLSILVYCIDSSLNFPLSRPVVSATYFVIIGVILCQINLKNFKLDFKKTYLVYLILSLLAVFPLFKLLQSGIEQRNLLTDYNQKVFNDPIEVIESYNDKFPSILQTGLPIKAMKGIYYFYRKDTIRAINTLKSPNPNDNPFVGAYEASLAQIYDAKGETDSALKYSSIAYTKLPNNLYHAGYYIRTLQKLKRFDDVVEVYKNYNGDDEALDYYYILSIYNPEYNFNKDSLKIELLNVRKKHPNNDFFKLAYQENFYGETTLAKANEYNAIANVNFENKNFQEAFDNYKKARELVSTEYSHSQNMGLSKFNLSEYQESIDILDFTIDSMIVPEDNGRIYAIRGSSKLMLENYDRLSSCSDFLIGTRKGDELSQNLLMQYCQSFIENIQFIEN